MTRIRRLDPETRERIAAGEVVTRPAAVVRELVENSLDAGATRVDVAVDGDGTDRIRVRDDGRGMSRADAALAVERHTTSKLSAGDDIEAVSTLGFRGEALPSIAAVSHLTLTTNNGGPRGTRVEVSAGAVDVASAGRAQGTTVEVCELFSTLPARRKGLADAATEFARVSTVVSRYALCHPGVRFSLSHDGRETFSTPGSGYVDALLGVYDREVAGQSTTFSFDARERAEDRLDRHDGRDDRQTRIEGVLCYPSVTRATRDHVYVAVNGRPLVDEALRRAVVTGYGSLLPSDRAPIAVVSIVVPPERVDHNVHPAKAAVDFRGGGVTDQVEQAVRDALSTADLRRSAEVSMALDETLTPVEGESGLGELSVIGQFRELYLLCAADDRLLIVDQHAAHERINYERLREAVGALSTSAVDPPATLSVSATEAALVDAHRETLRALGYETATDEHGTVRVSTVPAPLGRRLAPDSLRDVLAALDGGDGEANPNAVRDELLKELACHPSLKAGDTLSEEEAGQLLTRLGACDQPYACPHGRPTVLSVGEETLARGFERGNTRFG